MIISILNGDLRIVPQNVKAYGKHPCPEPIYFVDTQQWCVYNFPDRELAIKEFERMLTELDEYFKESKESPKIRHYI